MVLDVADEVADDAAVDRSRRARLVGCYQTSLHRVEVPREANEKKQQAESVSFLFLF